MKKILLLLLALTAASSLWAQANRYRASIFQVTRTNNVEYARAIPYGSNNTPQPLQLDIYEPTGDTAALRPVVISFYGGSFIGGSKEAADIVAWSDSLARHGYVCLAPNYRLGFNIFGGAGSVVRAGYRALQDARAAVRWAKENHATYRLDTNYIFVLGNSAGAITALQTAYASDADRPAASYGLNPGALNDTMDLGCIDCSGNTYAHSPKVAGVVGLWGAVLDLSALTPADTIPALMIHGTDDTVVPIDSGNAFGNASMPILYGSRLIDAVLDSLGIRSDLYVYTGQGHNFYYNNTTFPNSYWNDIFPLGRDFLCSLNPYCLPPVSVERLMNNIALECFPNPTQDWIQLNRSSQEEAMVELINVQGQVLRQTLWQESQLQWSLSDLPQGQYWVRVRTANGLGIQAVQRQ
jgi:acetyl esterase/lipase